MVKNQKYIYTISVAQSIYKKSANFDKQNVNTTTAIGNRPCEAKAR